MNLIIQRETCESRNCDSLESSYGVSKSFLHDVHRDVMVEETLVKFGEKEETYTSSSLFSCKPVNGIGNEE